MHQNNEQVGFVNGCVMCVCVCVGNDQKDVQ